MSNTANAAQDNDMTDEQILSIQADALAAGDDLTYRTTWVALGYHRHPGFIPATPAERADAIARLRARA